MLVTTTPGIEGHPVTEYLGVVTAQGVLGVNAFKDVGAGMRNIFGGRAKRGGNITRGVARDGRGLAAADHQRDGSQDGDQRVDDPVSHVDRDRAEQGGAVHQLGHRKGRSSLTR
jgi:hypothetical protein